MEGLSRWCILSVVLLLYLDTSFGQKLTQRGKTNLQNPRTGIKTDIVFVMDSSGSIGSFGFRQEHRFVGNLLREINVYEDSAQVSLIRYASGVDVLIHQMGGWPGNSKCEMMPALHSVLYTSGSTNTGEALQKARELFQSSRSAAKKVLVLLTDGYSNGNLSPGPQAATLRSSGVEVFAIGIGGYRYSELQAIASVPYGYHIYFYDTFNDFNQLAMQIRGDAHLSQLLFMHQSFCPVTCSSNADCTCETLSGNWGCHCRAGFSGLFGQCTECPIGTYKSELGPADRCDQCPRHSTTLSTRSTRIEDCVCMEGYNAIGTLQYGGVNCEIIMCDQLDPSPNVVTVPGTCTTERSRFKENCVLSCEPGFTSTSGQTVLVTTCGASSVPGSTNGSWTEYVDDFKCQDITPPSIVCPSDITADNDPGLDSAEVTWATPVAMDTTGVTPQVLSSITPPQRFTIGIHTLNYTAIDEEGLAASCNFLVEIRDITAPVCVSCPEDINEVSKDRELPIQWDEPTWTDNSGNISDVFRSNNPGSLFYWGAPQLVYYIARDNAGNKGFCNFTVIVKQHACPYQAPPQNGAIACDTWLGGQFCSVSCNRDF
ncbi:sushi, von Willebrand factor type A, EGF and pentraxin domain-containing protein 1-like isoform X2 [Branchiostoma floridae x Branchiostoma japonicum]